MVKKYKNLRVEEDTVEELKKIKRLYEVQDSIDYTLSQIIFLLIEERKKKQFILPDIDNVKS